MPVRKEGTNVFYYDEVSTEWLEGTIAKYIRGYGYTVETDVDGETMQLDILAKLIKTEKPRLNRARNRSRSRSRSMSRRTSTSVGEVVQENDNSNEAPEEALKERLETDVKLDKVAEEVERVVREATPPPPQLSPKTNVTIAAAKKADLDSNSDEQQSEQQQERGRPKSRRSLVDWAWENVDGARERTARDRRSLSRERGTMVDATVVGEIVVDEPEKQVESGATEVENKSSDEIEPAVTELTIDACPWYLSMRDGAHAVLLAGLLPVITLKYYDVVNGSDMLRQLITWRQYWTSQPFIFLASSFILLNRLKISSSAYLGLVATGIALYTQMAPQDYVWKWIPMCAFGHLITVYALSAFVFSRHQANVACHNLVDKLKLFVTGAETSCRVKDDLAKMGNLVGILILTFYMVNIDLAHIGATLSAVYLSSSMFLNMTVNTADAFGFGSIFKHCMFVPFISTLLPRLAYNQPQPINGEFYLLYLSILLFLIGLCQKLASINRSKPFTSQSDCLILGAAVLLGPINVISASIVIMCAALY